MLSSNDGVCDSCSTINIRNGLFDWYNWVYWTENPQKNRLEEVDLYESAYAIHIQVNPMTRL